MKIQIEDDDVKRLYQADKVIIVLKDAGLSQFPFVPGSRVRGKPARAVAWAAFDPKQITRLEWGGDNGGYFAYAAAAGAAVGRSVQIGSYIAARPQQAVYLFNGALFEERACQRGEAGTYYLQNQSGVDCGMGLAQKYSLDGRETEIVPLQYTVILDEEAAQIRVKERVQVLAGAAVETGTLIPVDARGICTVNFQPQTSHTVRFDKNTFRFLTVG